MDVSYSTYIRLLDEYKANCNLDETNTQSMLSYLCKVDAPTEILKTLRLNLNLILAKAKFP